MNLNLRTSAERDFTGVCPDCKEWTEAGDSCCGRGAYVEGSLISDESAEEDKSDPSVGITIAKDVTSAIGSALKSALLDAGIPCSLWGSGNALSSDKWNVTIHIPVSSLPTEGK